jgi:hypothetical protein
MTRPTVQFGLVLSILALSSCQMLVGHTGAARRVTEEQLTKIQEGMTIERVREELGRPWEIVVAAMGGSREVHRYRMDGEKYEEQVKSFDVEEDEYVTDTVTLTQLRIVELTFDGGKLVKGDR